MEVKTDNFRTSSSNFRPSPSTNLPLVMTRFVPCYAIKEDILIFEISKVEDVIVSDFQNLKSILYGFPQFKVHSLFKTSGLNGNELV